MKTFGVSALYNVLLGARNSVYLKAGGGTTKYGSNCPGTAVPGAPICGSSGALLGGAGFRVGITPTVMIRGRGRLQPQQEPRSDRTDPASPCPTSAATWA